LPFLMQHFDNHLGSRSSSGHQFHLRRFVSREGPDRTDYVLMARTELQSAPRLIQSGYSLSISSYSSRAVIVCMARRSKSRIYFRVSPSCPHGHSRLSGASCRHADGRSPSSSNNLSGVTARLEETAREKRDRAVVPVNGQRAVAGIRVAIPW